MSGRAPPPQRVPTLTEVVDEASIVELPPARPAALVELPAAADDAFAATVSDKQLRTALAAAAVQAEAGPLDEEALTQRILSELQRQIEPMLEARLRETLAPALARLTEALVRESRTELASALHELVGRAVAQELARRRAR